MVSVSLPTVETPLNLPFGNQQADTFISTVSVSLSIVATSISLPIAAGSLSLPIAAGFSRNQLADTSISTVSVNLPIVATFVSQPIAAPAIGTVPDVSLTFSAAPLQKRTRKSKPASTIIFPTDIDTIQKSHERDGNESENSYHTGDVRTDDSLLEEGNRLDADLARYNQIRRNLTDRDRVQDSDSGESSVVSSRTSSPPP